MIKDVFLSKMEMLGNPTAASAYIDDLRAARLFLMDAYKFKKAVK